MTVKDFIDKYWQTYQSSGLVAVVKRAAREVANKAFVSLYARFKQNRMRRQLPLQSRSLSRLQKDDNWLLLVFDAGRFDYMAPLLNDEFETVTQQQYSAARDTFEWISTQWANGVDDVVYVTAMTPISSDVPDFEAEGLNQLYHSSDFTESLGIIREVWKEHWDTGVAQVPPEHVVSVAEEYLDRDKLVVHFSQPHSPFIGTPKLLGHTTGPSARPLEGDPNDEPIWERVKSGSISDHHLKMAYQGNAARAVRAARSLVEQWDGRVVATADHGEALGELGMYAHVRSPHPQRRSVPWAEIEGVKPSSEGNAGTSNRKEQLRALGYRG